MGTQLREPYPDPMDYQPCVPGLWTTIVRGGGRPQPQPELSPGGTRQRPYPGESSLGGRFNALWDEGGIGIPSEPLGAWNQTSFGQQHGTNTGQGRQAQGEAPSFGTRAR